MAYRKPVHKGHSVRKFNKGLHKTKAANVRPHTSRGGYRL